MMTEYIERKAIRDALYDADAITMSGVKILNQFPVADVSPMRHGHWISLTECANEGVYCSICEKKVWKSDYAWCSKRRRNKLQSNYCPNCGAKMDGELNE